MMKKMKDACEMDTLEKCAEAMYKALDNKGKAQMALDIIYDIDPSELLIPQYVLEGLEWLQNELHKASRDFVTEQLVIEETLSGQ